MSVCSEGPYKACLTYWKRRCGSLKRSTKPDASLHRIACQRHPETVAEVTCEGSQEHGLPLMSTSINFQGMQLITSLRRTRSQKERGHVTVGHWTRKYGEELLAAMWASQGCLATLEHGNMCAFVSTCKEGPRCRLLHVFKHSARTRYTVGTNGCLRLL